MKRTKLFVLLFCLVGSVINLHCNIIRESTIVIKGNLKNLPDGILYIYNDRQKILDSTRTISGRFSFDFDKKTTGSYVLVTLEHSDKSQTRRLFHFKTNKIFKGGPYLSQFFIFENGVKIHGNLLDFIPKDIKLPSNIKIVYPSELIIGGIQNSMMNKISYDFNSIPSVSEVANLENLIREFPNSYYLLHEIAVHKNNYSAVQLDYFLSLFNKELRGSEDFQLLTKAVGIRNSNVYTIQNSKLFSADNALKNITESKAAVNMVILWASWCGPCLSEIPELAMIYDKYKSNSKFFMTSISLDTEYKDWEHALERYPMAWQQLWLQTSIAKYGTEIFQFDGSIPTVLFLNSKGEVKEKITGYGKNNLANFLRIINEMLRQEM